MARHYKKGSRFLPGAFFIWRVYKGETRERFVPSEGTRKAEAAGAQLCWAAAEPGLQVERD
jgi:hypothetical protein